MIRRLAIAVALLLGGACSVEGGEAGDGAGAGAGESPSETCNQLAGVICQKLFECYSAEERAAAMFPATEEECLSQMRGDLECPTQRADNQCEEGESYDPERAQDCLVEYQALTCELVREGIDDEVTPSCADVCE